MGYNLYKGQGHGQSNTTQESTHMSIQCLSIMYRLIHLVSSGSQVWFGKRPKSAEKTTTKKHGLTHVG